MFKKSVWLKENAKKVSDELKEGNTTIDEILSNMNYTDKEKSILRWILTD